MDEESEILALARRLTEELGEDAVRITKVRLVELIAANDLRAAAFWRNILRAVERLRAEADGASPVAAGGSARVPTTLH